MLSILALLVRHFRRATASIVVKRGESTVDSDARFLEYELPRLVRFFRTEGAVALAQHEVNPAFRGLRKAEVLVA